MRPSTSFKKEVRLKKPGEFNRVFLSRLKIQNRHFTIIYSLNTGTLARLGISVAKKQIRKAVERNKIKRIIRESFRKNRLNLPNLDVVVLAKKSISNETNSILFKSLDFLWSDLHKELNNHG